VNRVFFGFSGRKVEEAETEMAWSVNFFGRPIKFQLIFMKVLGQIGFK